MDFTLGVSGYGSAWTTSMKDDFRYSACYIYDGQVWLSYFDIFDEAISPNNDVDLPANAFRIYQWNYPDPVKYTNLLIWRNDAFVFKDLNGFMGIFRLPQEGDKYVFNMYEIGNYGNVFDSNARLTYSSYGIGDDNSMLYAPMNQQFKMETAYGGPGSVNYSVHYYKDNNLIHTFYDISPYLTPNPDELTALAFMPMP